MAHPDLDQLVNRLYPFAQEMLAKHGEFYPFGAKMDKNGGIGHVAGYTGDEHPRSQEVIELLVAGLRAQAQRAEIRAAGICLDVRVVPPNQTHKSDAICARLEHENGETVEVYLPYRKGRFGRIRYGEIFACQGDRRIFPQR